MRAILVELWFSIIAIVVLFLLIPGLLGAPWFPTKIDTVRQMLLMADVTPDDVVYDLGSGDGRVVLTAAKEFCARSVGIEVNPFWVVWTQLAIWILRVRGRAHVVWGSFFRKDFGDADVVVLYLLQVTNDLLQRKLETELKPGARVVSRTFIFRGWRPILADYQSKIYIYEMGHHKLN